MDFEVENDLSEIIELEEQANNFKTKYEKPHVYDCPYQSLECGRLEVMELPTSYDEKRFWWLHNDEEEEDDYDC